MRILKLNGVRVNVDKQTAIGIDLQTYDVKEPVKPKVNVSNSFTIPITNKNMQAIGYIAGVQNVSNDVYNAITADYWINNTQYIIDAKARIQGIQNRIEIFVFEKPDIWDLLKEEKWADFTSDYFDTLSIPKLGSPFNGIFANFMAPYFPIGGDSDIVVPYTKANGVELENEMKMGGLGIAQASPGGHVFSFLKPVFEYIESTYGVSFNTGATFDGNIFNDAVFLSMMWNVRNIGIDTNVTKDEWIFNYYTGTQYGNDLIADETKDKTLYDFVISVIQQFGLIKDETNGSIELRRFDDLEAYAEVVDFSGKLDSSHKTKFIPFVEGYSQNSRIKFKTVETGIDINTNSKVITCLNKNLDDNNDLFEIDGFIPAFTDENSTLNELIPIISTPDSFKDFKFFTHNAAITTIIKISFGEAILTDDFTTNDLFAPVLYALDSEYNLLDDALNYPKYYEIKKWVNALDLINFKFFKLYWIKELNGSFFINKIKGFNPELSRQATTMEVLKVSDRKPEAPDPPEPPPLEGNLTFVDSDHQGSDYYDVFADENFIYVAGGGSGLLTYSTDAAGILTFIDSDDQAQTVFFTRVWGDGSKIYTSYQNNTSVYSVDGSGNITLLNKDTNGYGNVYGNGVDLFAFNDTNIRTISVDGSGNITVLQNYATRGASDLWWNGTHLCGSILGGGFYTYSVDGSGVLTSLDSSALSIGPVQHLNGKDDLVFLPAQSNGIESYSVDVVGDITNREVNDQGGLYGDCHVLNNILIATRWDFGLSTYTFDSLGVFTPVDTDDQGGFYDGVYSDGTFVYIAARTGGLLVYGIT